MEWITRNRKSHEGDAVNMSKPTPKTIATFEAKHGGGKIKKLEHELEVAAKKVEALAGVQNKVAIRPTKESTFTFALTGDRHTGSLYHHQAALKAFYEYAATQHVECVYDAGDILDGHRVYKGHEFELQDLGLEKQVDRLTASAPRFIPTSFITGNHDASFKHAAGVPVGRIIEKAVGYKFLGEEQARIQYDTPNGPFSIMLLHSGSGSSYALSYRPQKIVESLEGGTKPDLLAIGHYHKAEMLPTYRNVCAIQVGTFQRQTPFMARGGLAAHVGGWIVQVIVGNGHNVIKGEFVAFYV